VVAFQQWWSALVT